MASDRTAPASSVAPVDLSAERARSSRRWQFYLVIAIAFGLPILSSLVVFFGHRTLHAATPGRTIVGVVFQLIGLTSLYLVLRHQKRSLSDIGVRWPMRLDEVGHAFGLFFGAFPVGLAVAIVLFAIYHALGHPLYRTFNDAALFGTRITGWTVLYVFLNPFHEELIVRGFLITEMEHFYKNTALAVFVSVFLQSSYHLYQGLAPAILHASTFLLFSIYFVKKRRILPVVMAHMLLDVSALMVYAHRLAK